MAAVVRLQPAVWTDVRRTVLPRMPGHAHAPFRPAYRQLPMRTRGRRKACLTHAPDLRRIPT